MTETGFTPGVETRRDNALLDTLGRRNRKLADRICPDCGKAFRPTCKTSKYCSRRCAWNNNDSGHRKDGPIWWKNARGYIEGCVWIDGRRARAKQHRWLVEGHLGRKLLPSEDVHHINGDRSDNRLENLQVLSHGNHTRITNASRNWKSGYKLDLTNGERQRRSLRAKKNKFWIHGQAALKQARGEQS